MTIAEADYFAVRSDLLRRPEKIIETERKRHFQKSPAQNLEELIGKECQNAEHDVQMHFGMTTHPHLPTADRVLQARIDPLTHRALLIAPFGRRVKEGSTLPRRFLSK